MPKIKKKNTNEKNLICFFFFNKFSAKWKFNEDSKIQVSKTAKFS